MADAQVIRKSTTALAGGRAFFVPSGFIESVKMTSVTAQVRDKCETYPTKKRLGNYKT